MFNENLEDVLATVWDFLNKSNKPLLPKDIVNETGLSIPKVLISLNKMSEIGLVKVILKSNIKTFCAMDNVDSMTYAKAIEIGIPLATLERTVGLSLKDKMKARELTLSGSVDADRKKVQKTKEEKREQVLRGRAASKAVKTDLAKIIQDTRNACEEDKDNFIKKEIMIEAEKAFESLINAMKK